MHRWSFPWLSLAVAVGALATAQSGAAPFVEAMQVRRLSPEEAGRAQPVQLRGVVTHVHSERRIFLQDSTAGIFVRGDTDPMPPVTQGDLVEVNGVTAAGLFSPMVEHASVRILGKGALPPPQPVSSTELASGQSNSQWVEVRGVVRAATLTAEGKAEILLTVGGVRLEVTAAQAAGADPGSLVDAELRCRGVVSGRFSRLRQLVAPQLLCQSSDQWGIEQAPPDIHALKPRLIADLLTFELSPSLQHRVLLRGVVTFHEPGGLLFLRDSSAPIKIQTRGEAALHPGDRVEVLGFPEIGPYGAWLDDATCRKIGSEAAPAPLPVQAGAILRERQDADLVSLEAELLRISRQAAEQIFTMRSGDLVFLAALSSPGETAAVEERFRPGSRLKLTGICRFHGQLNSGAAVLPEAFSLRLRSPADIVVVRQASWWTSERLLAAVGLLVALSAAAILSVWWLGWRLRRQARILSERVRRDAVLEERHRVALEIHDTLAQGFAAIWMQLALIKEKLFDAPGEALPHVELTKELVRKSLADARRSIRDLRDGIGIGAADLPAALSEIGEQLTKGTGVTVTFHAGGDSSRVPMHFAPALLRVGQEALTNAIKHAAARNIVVELKYGSHFVLLRIRDDGTGFDAGVVASGPRNGFGLLGMQERASQLGGELTIHSTPGSGTEIVLVAPVNSASASVSSEP